MNRPPTRLLGLLTLAAGLCLGPPAAGVEETFDINQAEWPARPTPKWVRGAVDQGALPGADPALKGIITPEGFKLEVVAREPNIIDPVGLTFGDDGTPYVIEWKKTPGVGGEDYELTYKDGSKRTLHRYAKRGGSIAGRPDSADWLKALHDKDGDGVYESHTVIMDDLQIPSTCLIHDGWFYFTSQGRVIRRKQSRPDGPFDITETIVQGLPGFNQHQASGLTMSHDGWLFITAGDDDGHAEGSDGSRVDLLRTGGIYMCRPDGSKLQLYARGFRNPYRDVVFDQHQNMFHMDNDQEDGSKWQGCRLIHVLEEADYGWRLKAGVRCCWPDMDRGAVSGERPGKMPVMMKTGRGAPAGLLYTSGAAMPEVFRGWLIYPDVFRKSVRAYRVERDATGSTFKVVEQFDLMKSEDGYFRPCQAVQGPDGAIYIVDWRTNSAGPGWFWGEQKFGRIYRLTWTGTEVRKEPPSEPLPSEPRPSGSETPIPAIARGTMDAWSKVGAMSNVQLWKELNTTDMELRKRVVNELVRRGQKNKETFIAVAKDETRPVHARIAAIGAACRLCREHAGLDEVSLYELLGNDKASEIRRVCADLIGRNVDDFGGVGDGAFTRLSLAIGDEDLTVRRSAAIAIGSLMRWRDADDDFRTIHQTAAISYLWGALASHSGNRNDEITMDGIVRALEQMKGEITNLYLPRKHPSDRERIIEILEALRVPLAAKAFDEYLPSILEDEIPRFRSDDRPIRLLTAYRNIQTEPPPDMTAVGDWLIKHPDASEKVQLAALETLAIVGDTNTEKILPIIEKMLAHDSPRIRLAVMKNIERQQLHATAPLLAKAMLDEKRSLEERRTALRTLGTLRASTRFATIKAEKGVELVVDDLVKLAVDPSVIGGDALRGEVLSLLARVDLKKAEPVAMRMLNSGEDASVKAAINALSAEPGHAKMIGRLFADGKIDRALLPQVAAALQKHALNDKSGAMSQLLAEVYRGGLLVANDAESLKQLESMVKTRGDAMRGRAVYLDAQKSQCALCHKLEGVGGRSGPIGPDLTKIGQAQTIAKLIESIIEPSKEIKEGFGAWTLTATDGQVYMGLKVAENDKAVTIRDVQEGEDVLIPRVGIKELKQSGTSVMPQNVVAQLSYDELIDLIAFLKDDAAQATLRGLLTRAWVIGPFDAKETAEGWESKPDPLAKIGDRQWLRIDCGPGATLDLKHAMDKTAKGDAYVLTYLFSPKDQKAAAKFTVSGAARIVLNAEGQVKVDAANTKLLNLPLKQGWNTLLARVAADEKGALTFGMQVIEGEGVRFGERAE